MQSILALSQAAPEWRLLIALQLITVNVMEKLSAEDALEARRIADRLGLRKLSDQDLVKLLNAARVADIRRSALDTSSLMPSDEPVLVFRLPGTGQLP